MKYERITCDDVEIDDVIARAKSHTFVCVFAINELPTTRRLHWYNPANGIEYNWRPRRTTKLWREVPDA